MDEIGAWAMTLYPNIGGFGSETFLGLGDPELMLAYVQAYNDWLIEWISPDPRRFIPVMATPFWDVDAAVVEIHRDFGCTNGPPRPRLLGLPPVCLRTTPARRPVAKRLTGFRSTAT